MTNAISITDLDKVFRIPHERRTTLRDNILGLSRGRVRYEDFFALKGINLSAEEGEFLGVIGENGSGKSTLLKIIGGVIKPTNGSVRLNGRVSSFIGLGIGFQMDLNARDNIRLYGAIMGLGRKEISAKIGSILKFSGLENFVDMKLRNYSSGMLAMLAFSIAIESGADILLVDEVLAVGDDEFQTKCVRVFHEFKKKGKTILFVSHDMGMVRKICDRVVLLCKGRVVSVGKPEKVIADYHKITGASNASGRHDSNV